MRKFLKLIFVIQEQEYKDEFKKGYYKRRINPFNPLSYITITLVLAIGLLMFGFVGFWKEADLRNPFKYK